MGRTACTEPQCLYKGALYHFTFLLCISGYTSSNSRNTEEVGNDLEGSGPDLIELTYRHVTGETEDNHTEPQLRQPVSRPRFEPGTTRTELGSVVA